MCKPCPTGVTIAFETNFPAVGRVTLDGRVFSDSGGGTTHEIQITGLTPNKVYEYTVSTAGGSRAETYCFKTAPAPGSRYPFVFAYTSDSRGGQGGGERDIRGVNAYMMRRIMALVSARNAAFLQFTGDQIYGYNNSAWSTATGSGPSSPGHALSR